MHRHRDGSRRLTPLLLPSRPRYITQVHMHTKAWQVVREAAASDWKFCIPSGPFLPAPASRMYDKCGRLTSDHGDYLYLGIDEVRDVAMSWFYVRMLVRTCGERRRGQLYALPYFLENDDGFPATFTACTEYHMLVMILIWCGNRRILG